MNADEPKPVGRKIWFPAKRHGWGWGPPCCWQGWVFFLIWLAALSGGVFYFVRQGEQNPVVVYTFAGVLLIVLILVCLLKGEKPGWRWGGK
jgi:hypothetical protein